MAQMRVLDTYRGGMVVATDWTCEQCGTIHYSWHLDPSAPIRAVAERQPTAPAPEQLALF